MPFHHLLESVSVLLAPEGSFNVIIPFNEEDNFITLAKNVLLFPNNICRVKGNPETEVKRSMLAFSFRESETTTTELIIETDRHQYTQDYINLTKDFYLKM